MFNMRKKIRKTIFDFKERMEEKKNMQQKMLSRASQNLNERKTGCSDKGSSRKTDIEIKEKIRQRNSRHMEQGKEKSGIERKMERRKFQKENDKTRERTSVLEGGQRKIPIQAQDKTLQRNTQNMRGMRNDKETYACASQRQRHEKQRFRKPNAAVPKMSYEKTSEKHKKRQIRKIHETEMIQTRWMHDFDLKEEVTCP